MKRIVFVGSAVLLMGAMSMTSFWIRFVQAASTDTVSATVTAQIFSVSVTDGTVAFGTVAQGSTQNTTSTGVNDSQTATNDGTVAAKLEIMGANSTGGAGWTLGATTASETYTLKFCTSSCDSSPTWTSVGIGAYATLAASVASSGTQEFDLQVGTPTSTVVTEQQSISVTVLATTP